MPRRFSEGCFSLSCTRKEQDLESGLTDSESDLTDLESDLTDMLELTPEDLSLFTGNFSSDNLVGVTQYCKLYRGKMPMCSNQENEVIKDVAVKVLRCHSRYRVQKDPLRLEDEVKFLQHPRIRGNAGLMKLIGCCRDDNSLGLVYDISLCDTLHNLIFRDDFKWLQRLNVALALARLLNFLQDGKSPYLIRNLNPAHVVLDKDNKPILFDLGMLVGEGLDKTISDYELGPLGSFDPWVAESGGDWSVKTDVFAFGVLLLNLMTNRITNEANPGNTIVHSRAKKEYKRGCSLVQRSLEDDPNFDNRDGPKITALAMKCIDYEPWNRPPMKKVIKHLKVLHAVQQHGKACSDEI